MRKLLTPLFLALALTACGSIGIGFSVPIGGVGSIGVGMGSDGRVGGSIGVGTGGVSVGVGGSTTLPRNAQPAASAASSP